jgi:signal peptidase I
METQTLRWLEGIWRSGAQPEGTWVALRGGSMGPTLREGDWLRVEPLGAGRAPRPGEVVVTRLGSRLVTHRLLEIRGELAVTRGDACRANDPPVPIESLLGRVAEVRRESSAVRLWHRSRRLLKRLWRER